MIEAVHQPQHFYDPRSRKELPLAYVRGKRVFCVSGIGDPAYFEEMVTEFGAVVAEHIVLPDHHNYTEHDRASIEKRAASCAADCIITTDKDAVKFARMSFTFGTFQLLTLVIALEITAGKELLVDRLHRLLRR